MPLHIAEDVVESVNDRAVLDAGGYEQTELERAETVLLGG